MNRREKLVDLLWENFATLPNCDFEKTVDDIESLYKSTNLLSSEREGVTKNKQFDESCDCWRCGDKAVNKNLCEYCHHLVFGKE